jgi:hypothetical protein
MADEMRCLCKPAKAFRGSEHLTFPGRTVNGDPRPPQYRCGKRQNGFALLNDGGM